MASVPTDIEEDNKAAHLRCEGRLWQIVSPDCSSYECRQDRATAVGGAILTCLILADFVAKVENRTTLKISRKGTSAAASLFGAPTEVRDRFWINRYGPDIAARKTHQWL